MLCDFHNFRVNNTKSCQLDTLGAPLDTGAKGARG